MPDSTQQIVIVGGGVAGVVCTEQLQQLPGLEIMLVSVSPSLKGVGNVVRMTEHAESFEVVDKDLASIAAKENTRVVVAAVVKCDCVSQRLWLSNGEELCYDKLCVCTGAVPKVLSPHPAVHTLRDTDSVQSLSHCLQGARRVLIVGNGGIALELVGALRDCLEIVWVLKHGHLGDAYFDTDAAAFLLQQLGSEVMLGSAPPASSSQSETTSQQQPVKLQQHHQQLQQQCHQQQQQQQVPSQSEAPPGHAAGPNWTQHLRIDTGIGKGDRSEEGNSRGEGVRSGGRVTLEFNALVDEVSSSAPSSSGRVDGGEEEGEWPVYANLTNGKTIGADLIISAIGVSPNTHWLPPELVRAEDNGLLVDERLCCPTGSDAPAGSSEYWGGDNARQAACAAIPERTVYAAGDCCTISECSLGPQFYQMRLWTQARMMGLLAAHSMAGVEEDFGSSMGLELFTHCTRFFGMKVVLLGLYNGQRLEHEPAEDIQIYVRQCEDGEDGSEGPSFVRVLLLRGRMQGCVLIGNTEDAETFEHLILDGLDLSQLGPSLLDPELEIADAFD